ncbi:7507_t:CDS:2, partial [Gigaspora rosea]
MNSCYNKKTDNSLNVQSNDPNTIKDVSFEGFIAYIANLRPSEADSLSNRSDNLDRIDQAKLPLDGEYNYPKSSGFGVNVYIVDTHGTHVAGIVGGITWGVAKLVRLISIKVFDASGPGTFADVIAGLAYIASQHANSTNKNTVVNMSLGGDRNQAVNDAVKALTSMGIHVVVAAGNFADDACNFSPASEPSAVCVGATEDISDAVASFSNFGSCVNIFAPGTNIKSAGITSKNSTAVHSGTSMATPH